MTYTDSPLTCRDCRSSFTFTTGEQEFHAAKRLANEPGRCPDPPQADATRRQQRSDGGSYSGDHSDRREMFTATCATCGKEARVPFQPRRDKPVYCSDCFRTQGGDRTGSGSGRQSWASRW